MWLHPCTICSRAAFMPDKMAFLSCFLHLSCSVGEHRDRECKQVLSRAALTASMCWPAVCTAAQAHIHGRLQQSGQRSRSEGPDPCRPAVLPGSTADQSPPGEANILCLSGCNQSPFIIRADGYPSMQHMPIAAAKQSRGGAASC